MSRAAIASSTLESMVMRNDQVLIRRDRREKQSKGGIILPGQAQRAQQLGTVISVGPGRIELGERIGVDLEEGDRVVFQAYAGTEFLTEDGNENEYVILQEKDVLGKL